MIVTTTDVILHEGVACPAPASIMASASNLALKVSTTAHYLCSVCEKTFSRSDSFKQHLGTHDRSYAYSCPEPGCDMSFGWATSLRRHREKQHHLKPTEASGKTFLCHVCDREFKSRRHLKIHVDRDHLKKRDHGCDQCSRSFFTQYDLMTHLRTHSGSRPFECGQCHKSFSHRSHQLRHERTTHDSNKISQKRGQQQPPTAESAETASTTAEVTLILASYS